MPHKLRAITSPENTHSALKLSPRQGKTAHLSRQWLTESPDGLNKAHPLLTWHSRCLQKKQREAGKWQNHINAVFQQMLGKRHYLYCLKKIKYVLWQSSLLPTRAGDAVNIDEDVCKKVRIPA